MTTAPRSAASRSAFDDHGSQLEDSVSRSSKTSLSRRTATSVVAACQRHDLFGGQLDVASTPQTGDHELAAARLLRSLGRTPDRHLPVFDGEFDFGVRGQSRTFPYLSGDRDRSEEHTSELQS